MGFGGLRLRYYRAILYGGAPFKRAILFPFAGGMYFNCNSVSYNLFSGGGLEPIVRVVRDLRLKFNLRTMGTCKFEKIIKILHLYKASNTWN